MPRPVERALLLRRFPFGESSLVVQALTREHGRVHLIAKGVYRPRSRFYAALDLFDTLELEWSQQAGRELQPLSAARILVRRAGLARSLAAYRAALAGLELAHTAAQEGRPERALFDLLERLLERLACARLPPGLAQVDFELQLLEALGLAPALGHCATCGRPAPAAREVLPVGARAAPRAAFSATAGGRLCRGCAEQARASGGRVGTLPLDVLEFARTLLAERPAPRDASLEEAAAMCDADGLERVRDFVARFLEVHLETRPKSYQALLASGNRNAPTR